MIKETHPGEAASELLELFKIKVKGILHVGAHQCEELPTYLKFTNNILWIEAMQDLIEENLKYNPELKIINAVVSDEDEKVVEFNVANNLRSSSILNLGYHKEIHPEVKMVKKLTLTTKTIQTLYKENNIKDSDYNVLVMDIQGAELPALKGMKNILNNFEAIHVEVNEKELYEGCSKLNDLNDFLLNLGFERKYLTLLNGYGNAFYLKK
jgi:FkbM family methyltransferase